MDLLDLLYSSFVSSNQSNSVYTGIMKRRRKPWVPSTDDIAFFCLKHLVITLTLPFNCVPILGTMLFLKINGNIETWSLLRPYLKHGQKITTLGEQWAFVNTHYHAFNDFGQRAMAYQLIPLFGCYFNLSNGLAAGMFAASLDTLGTMDQSLLVSPDKNLPRTTQSRRSMEPPLPQSNWPLVGDMVEVCLAEWDQYYLGEVVESRGSLYSVFFEGDGQTIDDIQVNDLRQPPKKKTKRTSVEDVQVYKIGERVIAKIPGWQHWYGGLIKRVNKDSTYTIDFDDGDTVTRVKADEIMYGEEESEEEYPELPHWMEKGHKVEVKIPGWKRFWPGVVEFVDARKGSAKVVFDDGTIELGVKMANMREVRIKKKSSMSSMGGRQGAPTLGKLVCWDLTSGGFCS